MPDGWWFPASSSMQAVSVVETGNIAIDILPCLRLGIVDRLTEPLAFQAVEEALNRRIVPAVAPATHALRDIVLPQECTEGFTGVLTPDRKSTRLNSSHVAISYAVFCLKKKSNRLKKLEVK